MPKFSINKMRSAGLRYLVVDAAGQAWAFEAKPVREDNHWRLADEHMCPQNNGDGYMAYWNRMMRCHWIGREICMPVSDLPVRISWSDEPYDIVEHGLVDEKGFKNWPEFGGEDNG